VIGKFFLIIVCKILILKSADLPVYNEILDGILESRILSHGVLFVYDIKNDAIYGKKIIVKNIGKFEIIVAIGFKALKSATDIIKDRPIVYTGVFGKTELTKRANVCGVPLDVPLETQIKILRETFGKNIKIGVIYSQEFKDFIESNKEKFAGIDVIYGSIENRKDVKKVLSKFSQSGCKFVWYWASDTLISSPNYFIKKFLKYCWDKGMGVWGISPAYVKAGAIIGISPDFYEIGHLTANFIKEVLEKWESGSFEPAVKSPSNIPVRIYINKTLADKLKIQLSDTIINKAQKIY